MVGRRMGDLVVAYCPPQLLPLGVVPRIVEQVERTLADAPGLLRHGLQATLSAMRLGLPVPVATDRMIHDLVVTLVYEQPEVHAALGYDLAAWVEATAATRAARWAPQVAAHDASLLQPDPLVARAGASSRAGGRIVSAVELDDEPIVCDAVVVGSGAGGSVVAAELAEAGWDVVVLEEGPHVPTSAFTTDALASFRTLYRDGGMSALLGAPPVAYSEGRCVGGSTTVNGGMSWRTPAEVLRGWRTEHALDSLDDAALALIFDRIERRLSTSSQDAESIGRDQELLRAGARALGWRVVDNRRAQVHCGGCNACLFGCPTGAKQSTLVSYLPRAVAFGARVIADCRVERVRFRRKLATGVDARTADGRRLIVDAPVVVAAAGAIQTPALLLGSGVRSPSGQLGRNLAVHPGANVVALFDEPVEGWKGVHQAYQVREHDGVVMAAVNLPPGLVARALGLRGAALGEVMQRYDHIVTAGVLVEDTSRGRVRMIGGRTVATYQLNRVDAQRIVTAVADLCELLLAAGAQSIHLPVDGSEPVTSTAHVTRLRRATVAPSALAVSTVHLMGTARMGGDPTRSVCDPHGRVHDTAGLYVADASLLPTPLGTNPMETIMALATLVAHGLITGDRRNS